MLDTTRYPKLNDQPHDRPILTQYGQNPLGELVWLLIPVAVIVIALLFR